MIHLPCRRVWSLAVAAATAAVFITPAVASAAAPAGADLNCTIRLTVEIHPGGTEQMRPFTTTSNGLTGTGTCTGTVDGLAVTGPAVFGLTTEGFGNCPTNTSTAEFVLRIPTVGGVKTVTGSATVVTAHGEILITGDIVGTSIDVGFVGNCITIPITSDTELFTAHIT